MSVSLRLWLTMVSASTPAEEADRDTLGYLYGGPRWKKKIQPAVLRRDPFCQRCGEAISTIADHRVPASEAIRQAEAGGRWPYDSTAGFFLMSNLQGLCRSCHKIKTDEDKCHVSDWPDVIAADDAAPKKQYGL